MIFLIIILALSVSIDSFGIGITYGIRNTSISRSSKLILFLMSFAFASTSVILGDFLFKIFPDSIVKTISSLLLVFMGFLIIYESYNKSIKKRQFPKERKIFLNFLGITIQIIKNPISSDINNSKIIEKNEALYLSLALSLDSICVGLSSSSFGISSLFFPILVPLFQFIFLNTGIFLGKKILLSNSISLKFCNLLSGILLILIASFRMWF